MVETPAGCLFEDIQYEDIQVEAVNFQQTEDIHVSSQLLIPAAHGQGRAETQTRPVEKQNTRLVLLTALFM